MRFVHARATLASQLQRLSPVEAPLRIVLGLFALVLWAMVGSVEPAAAQCDMVCPDGAKAKHVKHFRHAKHAAAKKPKKHAREIYMRAAPY
jgi:hypothetical protein